MPKQKTPKGASGTALSEISDPRFSNFTTDPRFRLPSKKHTRTKIDKRFSRMLKDDDFSNSTSVDRYGRKLSSGGKKKALEKLYVPDEESEDEPEVEEDEVVEKELKKAEGYDPARGGGFSSSEDEDDADEDDEDGGVQVEEVEEAFPDMQAEAAGVEMGEVSPRFAVVNLDWDNIKSSDLMAVFSSFVPPGGRILKISVYPSEFGKERMDREEMEGPPKEIFARKEEEEGSESDSEVEEDSDAEEETIRKTLQKADDGQEFDGAALRQYQLERLRYYYAVVVCSDTTTAEKIYESTDGTEYLSSANFFDLRFIPNGTEFDDKPRDECTSVPAGYRPTEFVTDALQHSKVKLTWDMTPEEGARKNAINRAFSGSRKEIGDNDLRAYLGSDSESGDSDAEPEVEDDTPKLTKKELARQKMRAALGLADEPVKVSKKAAPVGDMEITFTAGLTANGSKTGVFENDPVEATETTAERYKRLEKERKARRKAKAKAKRDGLDPDAASAAVEEGDEKDDEGKEDLGFNDPFFATSEEVKEKVDKSQRKADRLAKREAKLAQKTASASERSKLELLMAEDTVENPSSNIEHFDINEIARQEKASRKKGKKKERESKRGNLQENFEMDVQDPRFGKVFESHEFAIDPSNPKFKGTEGMKKLLEEGRRKRKVDGDEGGEEVVGGRQKRRRDQSAGGELSGLVEKLKKKSKR